MKRAGSTRRSWSFGLLAVLLLGFITCLPWHAAAQSSKIPGMSLGSFKVSNNGTTTYTIPIAAVPGTAGVTPQLALSYSQTQKNGLLGVGWSLAGLPVIHRCARTVAQDGFKGGINFNSNDRFCLSGQRLMVINGGVNGADQAEYRTEIDTFVRVFSYGAVQSPGSGPASFEVKNKTGETMEFGKTDDSRIEAVGKTSARVWALNNVKDTSGNYMTVSFDEDPVNGDYRPLRIDYTGNATQGAVTQRSVRFVYGPRTDQPQMYVGGSLVKTTKLLTAVQTYFGDNLVREYRLSYETATGTQRSRLKSVTECSSTCLPPTTFTWQEPAVDFNLSNWSTSLKTNNFVGDFDGNGKVDILSAVDNTPATVQLSQGSNFLSGSNWPSALNATAGWNFVGDFNGDGKIDIVSRSGNNAVRANLSTGSGFTSPIPTWTSNLWLNAPKFNFVGDFNGDGKGDILSRFTNTTVKVHLAKDNNGFDIIQTWDCPLWVNSAGLNYVADVNGDGKSDIVRWETATSVKVCISNGSGFDPPQSWVGTNLHSTGAWNFVGDFNGDSKADIASRSSATTVDVHLSTGTGFVVQTWTVDLHTDDVDRNFARDFNGDGLTDFVTFRNTSSVKVYFSTGSGFQLAGTPTTSNLKNGGNFLGDFSGDGKTDIMTVSTATVVKGQVNLKPIPDLLSAVTNNLGGKIDITYKPITDSTVYTKDSDAVYPVMDVQVPVYVVDNYIARTRADGSGQNFKYTYDYGGAKVHHLGRGGLGFRWIRVVDETPVANNAKSQTTTFFTQVDPLTKLVAFPKIGLPEFSESGSAAGAILAQVKNRFDVINTQPGVKFPALSRVDKFDCGPSGCIETAVKYEVDSFGNPTRSLYLGNVTSLDDVSLSGDERDERTEWVSDTLGTNWLHRPKHTLVSDPNLPVASNVLRESWLYYDDQAYSVLNVRGLLTKEESRLTGGRGDPGNPVVIHHYDGFGNRDSTRDPVNCLISTTFDSATHTFPETVTNCLSHVTSFTWDAGKGQKLSETDPNGQITNFNYDEFGRPTKIVGPLDTASQFGSISYNYLNWGNPVAQLIQTIKTKEHGTSIVIAREDYFDGLGRFYRSESDGPNNAFGQPQTIVEERTFDSRGFVTSKSAPHFSNEPALFTQFMYDVLGRSLQVLRPDSRFAWAFYEPGKMTFTDENDHERVKILDAYGRTQRVEEKNGTETYITLYKYDATAALVQTTNHLGHHTRIKYDSLGRKIAMCDPNMGAGPNTTTCDTSTPGAWIYTYDKASNLLTQTDPKLKAQNKNLTFGYDAGSRLVFKRYPDGRQVTFNYDVSFMTGVNFPIGRITKVVDLTAESRFVYDKIGRVLKTERKIGGLPHTMSQSYNALSKITSEVFPDNDNVSYIYDEAGWLKSIQGYVTQIDYNARGQKDQIQYINGVITTLDYFDQNVPGTKNFALKHRTTTGPSGNLQNLSYTYDDGSNIKTITDSLFTAGRTFTHDELNRLSIATGSFGGSNQSPTSESYTYDASGNILNKAGVTYQYCDHPQQPAPSQFCGGIIHPSAVMRTIDANNAEKIYHYDENGNTKDGASRTFAFNPDNRIDSVTLGSTVTMDYDYTGFRIRKTSGTAVTLTPFSGYEIGPDGTIIKHFITGSEILAGKKTPVSGSARKLFYHNDHLGGINVITDDDPAKNGARVQLTEYDPWGRVSRNEGSNVDPTNRFTGQKLDAETNIYYYGGRYYDQGLAKFVSPDPLIQQPDNPQNHNRYSYVINNPGRFTDPSGYSIFDDIFGWIGGIITGFFSESLNSSIDTSVVSNEISSASFDPGVDSGFDSPTTFTFTRTVGPPTWLTSILKPCSDPFCGAKPQSAEFEFPVIPGAGIIRGEFFIEKSTVFLIGNGDGRVFNPAPDPYKSRVIFEANRETGKATITSNPTCIGKLCVGALPIGENGTITGVGDTLRITGSFPNSFMREWGPRIDFDISITPNGISGVRDPFPSLEITSTINGVTSVIRNFPEARFVGERCLFLCRQEAFKFSFEY